MSPAQQQDRARQLLELRALAPLQAPIRGGGRFARLPVAQDDVDGLALFDVVRSPNLL